MGILQGLSYAAKNVWSGIKFIGRKILEGLKFVGEKIVEVSRAFIGGVQVIVKRITSLVNLDTIISVLVDFGLILLSPVVLLLGLIFISSIILFGRRGGGGGNDNDNDNDSQNDDNLNNQNNDRINQEQNENENENLNNQNHFVINRPAQAPNFDEEVEERSYDHTHTFLNDVNAYIHEPNSIEGYERSNPYTFSIQNDFQQNIRNNINNNDDSDLSDNNNIHSNVMFSQVNFRQNRERSLFYLLFENDINNTENGRRIINRIRNDLRQSLGQNYVVTIIEDEGNGERPIEDIQNINDISTIQMVIN